ncbi:MAG: permease-like cell division protein FtsX [Synergistaceae bacterium]|jgi:cell division transport system permease protein|nr:permease-like cell division protein FtsX [Synergistaceae bacterium]
MGSFKYAIRDASRLILRHWGLSALTILTSMAVFYLIGASVLLVLNTRHIVNILEGELSVQAYLSPRADPHETAQKVTGIQHVVKVGIITKEMALQKIQGRVGDWTGVMELLGENPLPESLEIWVDRASSVESVALSLSAMTEVTDVVYAGKLAEKLSQFSHFAGQFSFAILIVAITASAVVLFNTIRIAVYSKEEEIGIMLMVGATPTFVAMPFVLQGIILGGLGSLGASSLLAFSYSGIIARLKDILPFLPFLENGTVVIELGLILVGAGATVSLIASLVAVETFTKRAMRPL